NNYLVSYTKALQNQPFKLHYVDGFAGTGSYIKRSGGGERAGSAALALAVGGFDKYHLIEMNKKRCEILRRLAEGHQNLAVEVVTDDANVHIQRMCATPDWSRTRALVFLDPYGL